MSVFFSKIINNFQFGVSIDYVDAGEKEKQSHPIHHYHLFFFACLRWFNAIECDNILDQQLPSFLFVYLNLCLSFKILTINFRVS